MSTQRPYVFDILFYGPEVVLGGYGKSQGTVVRRPGWILPQVNGLGELLLRLAPASSSKPTDARKGQNAYKSPRHFWVICMDIFVENIF